MPVNYIPMYDFISMSGLSQKRGIWPKIDLKIMMETLYIMKKHYIILRTFTNRIWLNSSSIRIELEL
jgi:hypothetical protein